MELNYTTLDRELLHAITLGYNTIQKLEECDAVLAAVKPHQTAVSAPYGFISRRVQALRQRGMIRCTGRTWSRVITNEPAPRRIIRLM